MKRYIIIPLLLMTGCTGAFAQSMLKVSLTDKEVINVALDGRYFNKKGTSVTIGDLPPGDHYMQIYGVEQKRNGKLHEVVLFESAVTTNNGMTTLFVYDPASGKTDVQQQDINTFVANNPLPQYKQQQGGNNGMNNNDGADNNGNYNNAPAASAAPVENGTLTTAKTDDLKIQVGAKKTDTDKMKLLKNELQNETITTDQAATIMDWFGFESSKLDFLEWAYTITVDKENFGSLDAKFSYKNYQDDFDKFVSSKK